MEVKMLQHRVSSAFCFWGMVKGPHPAARKNGEQPTHFQE